MALVTVADAAAGLLMTGAPPPPLDVPLIVTMSIKVVRSLVAFVAAKVTV